MVRNQQRAAFGHILDADGVYTEVFSMQKLRERKDTSENRWVKSKRIIANFILRLLKSLDGPLDFTF